MAYTSRSNRRRGANSEIWPGFVDVLSTLLLVMIFLLVVYMLAQYFLQRSISEKSQALDQLHHQVEELSTLLSLEQRTVDELRTSNEALFDQLEASRTKENLLALDLAKAQEETEILTIRLQDMTKEAQTAIAAAMESNEQASEAQLRVEAGEKQIEIMLSQIAQLQNDIDSLQKVRKELELNITTLSQKLAINKTQSKALDVAFSAARDRSSELMAELSTEEERTALAQKELQDRDIRLKELQGRYLIAKNNLESTNEKNRKHTDEIAILNNQILELRAQLTRLEAVLEASEIESIEKGAIIADLGRRLNLALAAKIEELAQYRSEFFGRLKEVLADRKEFNIIGDRFVFQSEVLFRSGSAELGPAGKKVLRVFAGVLKDVMRRIPNDLQWVLQVDGHTDRRPIKTARFPSNWELSAARAIEVVNHLVAEGIPPQRLSATGYGEFQPLDKRDDEIAYRRNRRIELKLTQR